MSAVERLETGPAEAPSIEAELMGRVVPMQAHEASSPEGEQPSAQEDAST